MFVFAKVIPKTLLVPFFSGHGVNKLEGPDLIHSRMIYEIRSELTYPLTKLFNNAVPEIWKCANISPIYKKSF